jgi:hypothetical protein
VIKRVHSTAAGATEGNIIAAITTAELAEVGPGGLLARR